MERTDQWILGPESIRMVNLGHPWIIADSYTKRWPAGKPGRIIELCDHAGSFVATALLDPGQRIVARILSRGRMRFDQAWLTARIRSAVDMRRCHLEQNDSNAYRIVNGEGDRLPGLTIDRYGDFLMLQLYSNGWRPHLNLLVKVLQELLRPAGIYEKNRPQNTRELEATGEAKRCGKLLSGVAAPQKLEIRENGLTFLVSLETGLNTGLFLDQRRNRADLMKRARGARVLNLFAYTGAFSVAAAAAGAERVINVDASPGYTEWARANFLVNRLDPGYHEFIVGDCFKVLTDLARRGECFDIILMDPPSFSTTAASRFTTRGGTSDLVAAAMPLLSPNGLLFASSNHQKVDAADYLKELRRGALQAGTDLNVISMTGQPEDFPYPVTFPEGRYLKLAVCVKPAWV